MYGFFKTLDGTVDDVKAAVVNALAEEGFGVLSEIDVKATLKKKLGIDRLPYIILGACQPALANQAIEAEPDIGLLLPCNVLVREEVDGSVSVGFIDPEAMLSVTGRDDLKPFANEVRNLLERVRDRL
ncbi:MAG: hypothetical protein DHS20C01_19280 [marine bacterium B5-7]|nr:MAG: hypothetical protein DHS20C01_19280 [marine bacterium B5-7]